MEFTLKSERNISGKKMEILPNSGRQELSWKEKQQSIPESPPQMDYMDVIMELTLVEACDSLVKEAVPRALTLLLTSVEIMISVATYCSSQAALSSLLIWTVKVDIDMVVDGWMQIWEASPQILHLLAEARVQRACAFRLKLPSKEKAGNQTTKKSVVLIGENPEAIEPANV